MRRNRAMSLLCHLLCAMHYLMYQPAMPDTANHASTRRQARTDGGGGEKESSVPELCSLESVCGQEIFHCKTHQEVDILVVEDLLCKE